MINPFKKSYSSKELITFRFMSRIKIFERLNYKEMSFFLPYMYLREYKMDEVVFFRNDPANALYLVKSGKISINIDINEQFEVLKIVKSGDAFGDNSLLSETNRNYTTIVHSERAEVFVLPKVNIHEIFEEHSSIKIKMMESLCEVYDRVMSNVFKSYKSSMGLFELSQIYNS